MIAEWISRDRTRKLGEKKFADSLPTGTVAHTEIRENDSDSETRSPRYRLSIIMFIVIIIRFYFIFIAADPWREEFVSPSYLYANTTSTVW